MLPSACCVAAAAAKPRLRLSLQQSSKTTGNLLLRNIFIVSSHVYRRHKRSIAILTQPQTTPISPASRLPLPVSRFPLPARPLDSFELRSGSGRVGQRVYVTEKDVSVLRTPVVFGPVSRVPCPVVGVVFGFNMNKF